MTILKWAFKQLLSIFRIDHRQAYERIYYWSVHRAAVQQSLIAIVPRLREIEPDLSEQYSVRQEFGRFQELKLRVQHAFQCEMLLEAVKHVHGNGSLTVVDIGDSAGTHMKYLRSLIGAKQSLNALSVNSDARAVAKVQARGGTAVLARAEELDLGGKPVDLFATFQMVEHLHDPAAFFRRLADRGSCDHLVMTVPYQATSRVGLAHVRRNEPVECDAESVHIFELCPEDWSLLIRHAGWRVEYERTYLQYPVGIPVVSGMLRKVWRANDFEGFWGAVLRRDKTFADCYKDW